MDNKYEMFLYWIREREYIRQAKEDRDEPKPWSHDTVFQTTYFCNVHREDDRVTRWIRENWKLNSVDDYLVAMAVARFVNKPRTLEALGYPEGGCTKEFKDRWWHVMEGLDTPWGNAYLVSTNGVRQTKFKYIWDRLKEIDTGSMDVNYDSLAACHKSLMKFDGLGSFMAGQLIADFKNTPTHPLYTAFDWDVWCAHGPGSLRGMAWVRGMDKCTPTNFYREMGGLMADVRRDIPEMTIHAQDLQNCLCEFDKYCRVFYKTGRSKRKYDGA